MNKKYSALLNEGWERSTSALADLGLREAERLRAKAYLRAAILRRIASLQITQGEAARRVGLPQPKMSNLMNDVAGFSSDRLIDLATKLGLDVEIRVRPSRATFGRVITTTRSKRRPSTTQPSSGKPRTTRQRKSVKKARSAKAA